MELYRTYRLQDTAQRRTGSENGKVRDRIKREKLTFGDSNFSGEDTILILELLARIVEEANNNQMSEARAFVYEGLGLTHLIKPIALLFFFKRNAAAQFRSV